MTLALSCLCATARPVAVNEPGCPKHVVTFKVTKKAILQMDKVEAQGHQPWRSDPRKVAFVWACQADPRLTPRAATPPPYRHRVVSFYGEIFTFCDGHHNTVRVTVRRFRYRDPDTGKESLSVWWATRAVVVDCPPLAKAR
jgi:hypothetical protein